MRTLCLVLLLTSFISATDIECILRHSACAELDSNNNVNVHTTSNDNISVKITGLGNENAILNVLDDIYVLHLFKKDSDALFYIQEGSGLIIWTYFKKSNCIIYTKLRAFPLTKLPDSYLMISTCNER